MFGTTPLEELLPSDHPLRKIRSDFDAAYARLASAFETSYGTTGNVSVPSPVLLRAWLLMALYSLKSERALCEQITMNAGFRWFVGLDWDDKVFDHSTLSKNRERFFGSGAAEALLGEVVRIAQSRRLLSSDRLVVDGTLIKAWASHKSFKAKDGADDDRPNFKGTWTPNSIPELAPTKRKPFGEKPPTRGQPKQCSNHFQQPNLPTGGDYPSSIAQQKAHVNHVLSLLSRMSCHRTSRERAG